MRFMKRIKWSLDESVVLIDAYIKNNKQIPLPTKEIEHLSMLFNKRAKRLNLDIDEKFRNQSGLNMQAACIHYVFTNGKEGLSNANDMFYKAYDLFKNHIDKFNQLLDTFYKNYSD